MPDNDSLLGFITSVSGDQYVKVEENLGDGFVRLKISEAERRQAMHDIRSFEDVVVELLRNSRDAHARRIFVATSRDGDLRNTTVVDDGVGVPEHLHETIFEPRVTSKLETMVMDRWGVHGRGMALFSVRSTVESARVAASDSHRGLSLAIVSDTTKLAERADQSAWPTVEMGEDGRARVARGPHNINRSVVEFALEHPEVDVYLGTPTEVLSTLHTLAHACLDTSQLMFCDDPAKLPVWQRPAIAADADELVEVCASIGLHVSERTAHRVLAGELSSLDRVADMVVEAPEPVAPKVPDIYKDRRGIKIHHTDMAAFKRELEGAFDYVSERYYLQLKGEPRVTVDRDGISVRFQVDKED
jgi:hypothetical protein